MALHIMDYSVTFFFKGGNSECSNMERLLGYVQNKFSMPPLCREKKKECITLYACKCTHADDLCEDNPRTLKVPASAQRCWVAGDRRKGDFLFTVHPSSLFEFATRFLYYLAKTLFNLTK